MVEIWPRLTHQHWHQSSTSVHIRPPIIWYLFEYLRSKNSFFVFPDGWFSTFSITYGQIFVLRLNMMDFPEHTFLWLMRKHCYFGLQAHFSSVQQSNDAMRRLQWFNRQRFMKKKQSLPEEEDHDSVMFLSVNDSASTPQMYNCKDCPNQKCFMLFSTFCVFCSAVFIRSHFKSLITEGSQVSVARRALSLFLERPYIFLHNNVKPHSAWITTGWLCSRRVHVPNWPVCSPD